MKRRLSRDWELRMIVLHDYGWEHCHKGWMTYSSPNRESSYSSFLKHSKAFCNLLFVVCGKHQAQICKVEVELLLFERQSFIVSNETEASFLTFLKWLNCGVDTAFFVECDFNMFKCWVSWDVRIIDCLSSLSYHFLRKITAKIWCSFLHVIL